jgi:phosphoenolpyruvate synthase/pyruvate phosphate dikinase
VTVVDLLDASADEVGGKAAGLAALLRLGLPVPAAVVVPASANGVIADAADVAARVGAPLAVRSSGVHEDTEGRSAAGQYDSLMGVDANGLADAVLRVYRSGGSARVRAYSGAPETAMAVIVQHEVAASRSGVAFSRDPVTGSDEVVIEAVFGHGEMLVSGKENPDRYRVDVTGRVSARVAARSGPLGTLRTLRDDEARRVAEMTRLAASGLGCAVDVEFCFERGTLWLVQCRPITTL